MSRTIKEQVAIILHRQRINRKALWVVYFDDAPILGGKAYISPAKARARIKSMLKYNFSNKTQLNNAIEELEKEGLLIYKQAK